MKISHVTAHPNRDTLEGVGGLPLGPVIVYTQDISPIGPDGKRVTPYTEAVPRIGGGKTWNGGALWLEGFDADLLEEACWDTSRRLCEGLGEGIANIETEWSNKLCDLPAHQLAESCKVLSIIGGAFASFGPFPHHDWKPTDEQLPHLRRVATSMWFLDLDCYWWRDWDSVAYWDMIVRIHKLVVRLGRAPSEARPRLWAFREGADQKVMLTAEELRWALGYMRDAGFRHVHLWHDGDRNTDPKATDGSSGVKNKSFAASKAWCEREDIRRVLDEFSK